MAEPVPPGDCTCDHLCPDCPGCIAIYVHDKTECWLMCPCNDASDIPEVRLALDARINIETRDTPLVQLAVLLEEHCVASLLIPAALADSTVSLYKMDTTLSAVITEVGLVIAP